MFLIEIYKSGVGDRSCGSCSDLSPILAPPPTKNTESHRSGSETLPQ